MTGKTVHHPGAGTMSEATRRVRSPNGPPHPTTRPAQAPPRYAGALGGAFAGWRPGSCPGVCLGEAAAPRGPRPYLAGMNLWDLLTPETRIIDVGVTAPVLAQALAGEGNHRYLGLVHGDLAGVRQRAGVIDQRRFQALTSSRLVTRNSTDLLVLREPFARRLWSVHELRHVRFLAVETRSRAAGAEARLARLAGRLARHLTPRGRVRCGDVELDVVELEVTRPDRPRRYLSPVLGVDGLIARLGDAEVRYAALRWFESLPHLDPGEDLDLLVADEHLALVQAVLAEEPGTIPVDLYSETGLPGADFHSVAYYPPTLATQILERAVQHRSGALVPSPADHLRSLAFHAAYHKGAPSGLPSELGPDTVTDPVTDPEHDYPGVLARLATEVGVELPGTLEGVDAYLDAQGWRPPLDTLLRLNAWNPWIGRRFFPEAEPTPDLPELAVFLVRERTATVVSTEEVLAVLEELGFTALSLRTLDDAARSRCAAHTRGGNWGPGPFPRSGGDPVTAVVTVDYAPRVPDASERGRYPRLSDVNVLLAKRAVRDLISARLPSDQRFNPLHSSDSEVEAWEYVSLALPEEEGALRQEVERRRGAYRTAEPVVTVLSRGRRAKVEVVHSEQHGTVVRKTFAPGYERHMERELLGLRTLGPLLDAVPDLLETGPNWFSCPHYANELGHVRRGGRLLSLRVAREMVAVLQRINDEGFDLIDAKPENFLLDPRHGLKLVDYEFLHRYDGAVPALRDSYGLRGVPAGFTGDVPSGPMAYEWRWRAYTGLPLAALVGTPIWRQHLHRSRFRLRRALLGPTGPVRTTLEQLRVQAPRARRGLTAPYSGWARRRANSLLVDGSAG